MEAAKEKECVLCWETPPQTILVPCGHQIYCEECLKSHKQDNCAICRAPISHVFWTNYPFGKLPGSVSQPAAVVPAAVEEPVVVHPVPPVVVRREADPAPVRPVVPSSVEQQAGAMPLDRNPVSQWRPVSQFQPQQSMWYAPDWSLRPRDEPRDLRSLLTTVRQNQVADSFRDLFSAPGEGMNLQDLERYRPRTRAVEDDVSQQNIIIQYHRERYGIILSADDIDVRYPNVEVLKDAFRWRDEQRRVRQLQERLDQQRDPMQYVHKFLNQ